MNKRGESLFFLFIKKKNRRRKSADTFLKVFVSTFASACTIFLKRNFTSGKNTSAVRVFHSWHTSCLLNRVHQSLCGNSKRNLIIILSAAMSMHTSYQIILHTYSSLQISASLYHIQLPASSLLVLNLC